MAQKKHYIIRSWEKVGRDYIKWIFYQNIHDPKQFASVNGMTIPNVDAIKNSVTISGKEAIENIPNYRVLYDTYEEATEALSTLITQSCLVDKRDQGKKPYIEEIKIKRKVVK